MTVILFDALVVVTNHFPHLFLLLTVVSEHEYCSGKAVDVACASDEVIVTTHAQYGRMRKNSCVKMYLGYMGCGTSVLPVLDSLCSGRRACHVNVPNDQLNGVITGCLVELVQYLQAAFTCQKGTRVLCDDFKYTCTL